MGIAEKDDREAAPRSGRASRTSQVVERREAMRWEVLNGLSKRPKELPSKYFYDERGSQLFEAITALPEYYLTRTETAILEHFAPEIAKRIEGVTLVEYGSGSSNKTRILLDQVPNLPRYVPIDISGDFLLSVAAGLRAQYHGLDVVPVDGDYTRAIEIPRAPGTRVVAYFPGSTIGNFSDEEAFRFLSRVAGEVGAQGGLLIGFDLVKSPALLEAAYNDRAGVTAAFNLNLLVHLNRVLDVDFDVSRFAHRAVWNPAESQVEMHLISLDEQEVALGGARALFRAGEPVLTERCQKYTLASFSALAGRAGFSAVKLWTDPNNWFCVGYFARRLGRTRAANEGLALEPSVSSF